MKISAKLKAMETCFCSRYLQRALALACMLAVTQQFSGINAIIYYSEPIFRAVIPDATLRDTPDLPKYLVAVVGLVQLLITIVSFYTIDRLGRRLSILIGLIGKYYFNEPLDSRNFLTVTLALILQGIPFMDF